MGHHYLPIKPSQINTSEIFGLHPYLPEGDFDNELAASIRKFGLLSPPTLLPAAQDNHFDILCGHRRLRNLRKINHDEILCRIYPKPGKIEEALTFLLEEQRTNGVFTLAESICFLKLCTRHIPDKARLQSYINTLPSAAVPGGYRFIESLGKLNYIVLQGLHTSTISAKTAKNMLCFSSDDQTTLAELITRFQLGFNKQKKMLDMIIDILDRLQISLKELLLSDEIDELLHKPGMNEPQRATKFLGYLDRLMSPKLSSARDHFHHSLKKMDLPMNCHVEPSLSFERDEVKMTVRFRNFKDFQSVWQEIAEQLRKI